MEVIDKQIVANVRMKKSLLNTNIVVSVVNISRNIITKTATTRTHKKTEPPKK